MNLNLRWQGYGERRTLIHCCWECQLALPNSEVELGPTSTTAVTMEIGVEGPQKARKRSTVWAAWFVNLTQACIDLGRENLFKINLLIQYILVFSSPPAPPSSSTPIPSQIYIIFFLSFKNKQANKQASKNPFLIFLLANPF